uniref:Uncharacterized protein n=1 Tax=Hyaloperonospora arabidopsidis (strain Emoy2) TaxID=559515 RepID=M4C606_HYAAE
MPRALSLTAPRALTLTAPGTTVRSSGPVSVMVRTCACLPAASSTCCESRRSAREMKTQSWKSRVLGHCLPRPRGASQGTASVSKVLRAWSLAASPLRCESKSTGIGTSRDATSAGRQEDKSQRFRVRLRRIRSHQTVCQLGASYDH